MRKVLAIRRERPRPVALRPQHVADLGPRHRQIPLPARVRRVRRREAFERSAWPSCDTPRAPPPRRPAPRNTSPILFHDTDRSRCQPAFDGSDAARRSSDLRDVLRYAASAPAPSPCATQHVADLVPRHRQIPLPARVRRLRRCEAFTDREAVAIRRERPRPVALRLAACRRSSPTTPTDPAASPRSTGPTPQGVRRSCKAVAIRRERPRPVALRHATRRRSCSTTPTDPVASPRSTGPTPQDVRRILWPSRYAASAPAPSPCATQHVADPLPRHRQIPLPARVRRVRRCKTFGESQGRRDTPRAPPPRRPAPATCCRSWSTTPTDPAASPRSTGPTPRGVRGLRGSCDTPRAPPFRRQVQPVCRRARRNAAIAVIGGGCGGAVCGAAGGGEVAVVARAGGRVRSSPQKTPGSRATTSS